MEYMNTKTSLIMALEKASYVSITADMGSSRRRCYIGTTVHWLGNDLFIYKRRSACLGVRPVIGSHIYDVIARSISSVHKEFGI